MATTSIVERQRAGVPDWPLSVAFLFIAVSGALLWNTAMVNDVGWQLWVARQVAHGATLYSDIIEINPPLWFWEAVPVVDLAELTGATPYHVLILCVLAINAAALSLVRWLCRDMQSGVVIILSFPLITMFAFIDVFGQREHLTFISITPYLFLIARRADGLESSRVIAIVCGALAALGIALKPHFLLAPAALEILLLARTRRLALRPETLALGAILIGYLLSVILFARAYFFTIVPMVALAYHGYDQPILYQLHQPVVTMASLLLLSLPLYGWPRSSVAQAALTAGLAFLAAYFLQSKGWRYHSVPAMGCFALVIVAEAGCFRWHATSLAQRVSLALAALIMLCPVLPLVRAARLDSGANAREAIRDLEPGNVVAVLSTSGARYWPIPEERHLIWPSRYMTYWMLFSDVSPDPTVANLERAVRHNAAHDLACHPPRRILEDNYNVAFQKIGMVQRLSLDPDFARVMRAYRRGPDYGEFSTYDLVGRIGYHPTGCRKIV